MYRLALNKTAARSSVRYAAAARASARIVSTRPAARSYSSGHSSQQEESSPFKIVTYIAPTVLALAAYYGIVEIPNNRAKAAKQAAKQQQQEETAPAAEEFVSEPEPSQSEPEALPQTPVEATSDSEPPAAATTESETVSEDPLPEVAKESIDLLSADLEEAIKEGAIHEKEPVEDAAAVEATDAAQAGAFNPDTGEINWDCPCLGGMANGPCGEEFKTAFSCFVYSEAEPKGVDCIEKFSAMQDCFRRHPDVYAEELTDAQPFADENNQGIVAAEEAVAVTESSEPASAPSEVAETAAQPEPEATTPTETVKEDN